MIQSKNQTSTLLKCCVSTLRELGIGHFSERELDKVIQKIF